jgi:hypothetical protein
MSAVAMKSALPVGQNHIQIVVTESKFCPDPRPRALLLTDLRGNQNPTDEPSSRTMTDCWFSLGEGLESLARHRAHISAAMSANFSFVFTPTVGDTEVFATHGFRDRATQRSLTNLEVLQNIRWTFNALLKCLRTAKNSNTRSLALQIVMVVI